jgi:5-methylcytosine-specific restriction protein B
MARVQTEAAEAVYRASEMFVDRALRDDDSLFTPGAPIWSNTTVSDLYERFVVHEDGSKRSFVEKFRDQLAGARPATIQFAAEVIYVYFLIDRSVLGQTKRGLIKEVLSWSPEPVSMPATLDETLDSGIASTGTGFNTRRPGHLRYLIEFVKAWKEMEASEVEAALADPWRFEGLVHALNVPASSGQREALVHLVFPGTFEPIISVPMKQQIADGFPEAPGGAENLDRRLAEIRAYLAPKYGENFTFYQADSRSSSGTDSAAGVSSAPSVVPPRAARGSRRARRGRHR